MSERNIAQIIIALSGSNQTIVLDDPFNGLPHVTVLKLMKIIEQKVDTTLIVSARSMTTIEMLQPNHVMTI